MSTSVVNSVATPMKRQNYLSDSSDDEEILSSPVATLPPAVSFISDDDEEEEDPIPCSQPGSHDSIFDILSPIDLTGFEAPAPPARKVQFISDDDDDDDDNEAAVFNYLRKSQKFQDQFNEALDAVRRFQYAPDTLVNWIVKLVPVWGKAIALDKSCYYTLPAANLKAINSEMMNFHKLRTFVGEDIFSCIDRQQIPDRFIDKYEKFYSLIKEEESFMYSLVAVDNDF